MRIDPLQLMPVNGRLSSSVSPTASNEDKPFSQVLSEAMGEVNQLQQKAASAGADLAAGNIQDISEVVIATEKATIALQLTMQVRNKVVEAYQEVMRMQV